MPPLQFVAVMSSSLVGLLSLLLTVPHFLRPLELPSRRYRKGLGANIKLIQSDLSSKYHNLLYNAFAVWGKWRKWNLGWWGSRSATGGLYRSIRCGPRWVGHCGTFSVPSTDVLSRCYLSPPTGRGVSTRRWWWDALVIKLETLAGFCPLDSK